SRRRHTRFDCDWSSDVCSSDLVSPIGKAGKASDPDAATARPFDQIDPGENRFTAGDDIIDNHNALAGSDSISLDREGAPLRVGRSEERRVGKECRAWWSADY